MFDKIKCWLRLTFRRMCMSVLKSQPMPQHVAFIVDGNRTYARKVGIPYAKVYKICADEIIERLRTCSELDFKIVSMFLFSQHNVNRPKEETDLIFESLNQAFHELIAQPFGGCYKMIGDRDMLPDYFVETGSKLEEVTKNNTKFVVYLALGYTGRSEQTDMAIKIQSYISHPSEITVELANKLMYLADSTSSMLLIRTGVKRFSDYLTWQNAFSALYFSDKFWPKFTDWDLFRAVFYYQHYRDRVDKAAKVVNAIETYVYNSE